MSSVCEIGTFELKSPRIAASQLKLIQISKCYIISVRMPPDIITGPIPHIVFRPDDVVDLTCIAVGSPKPR